MLKSTVLLPLTITYQFLLLLMSQLFNMPFPALRLPFIGKSLKIDKTHRQARPGVFTPAACIVRPDPFFQVICPACVKAAVTALQNVGAVFALTRHF